MEPNGPINIDFIINWGPSDIKAFKWGSERPIKLGVLENENGYFIFYYDTPLLFKYNLHHVSGAYRLQIYTDNKVETIDWEEQDDSNITSNIFFVVYS